MATMYRIYFQKISYLPELAEVLGKTIGMLYFNACPKQGVK
jgi:hypothetical protein